MPGARSGGPAGQGAVGGGGIEGSMLQLEARWLAYGLMVLPIASVHVWFPVFADRYERHESRWIGFVGGVALGYVVLSMLPKVGVMSADAARAQPAAHPFVYLQAYLMLLLGIVLYILIDRLDQSESSRNRLVARSLDYGAHAAYSFVVGYLCIELPEDGLFRHGLAASILILHLMGMSNLLRHHRPDGYPTARWFLATLVLLGGATGLVTQLPKTAMSAANAFLCGIIILNVVSEELPIGHKGRLRWFFLGVSFLLVVMGVLLSWPPEADS